MKPILEVTLKEWAATRAKLLNTYGDKTGDTRFSAGFIRNVRYELNLDLSRRTPYHPDSLDMVLREINVMRSVIEDIDELIDEEYDPYCENIYHEDDPRLFEGTTQ